MKNELFAHVDAAVETARNVTSDPSPLSHADLCHLSRVFNEHCDLRNWRDCRINAWLKDQISAAYRRNASASEPTSEASGTHGS